MQRLIKRAAKSADNAWAFNPASVEDLIQDLWVTYLSDRSYQIDHLDDGPAFAILRGLADRLLSEQSFAWEVAMGERMYSADSIKDVLRGVGENPFLQSVIHLAVERISTRHRPYAEALKLRYIDGEIPKTGSDRTRLSRAHKALTEEVHAVITGYGLEPPEKGRQPKDGPGSRHAVFPDSRRQKGGRVSDPTGDVASLLADSPEYREVYYLEAELALDIKTVPPSPRLPNTLSVFDGTFNGAETEMYRGWVMPELYPHQPEPRLSNWSAEDLEMYVGGSHTPGYESRKEAA